MKTHQHSVWSLPGPGERRRNSDDDDEQRYRRKEAGGNCCRCCSRSIVAGVLVGLLICGAGIVPAVTLLFTRPTDTASTSSTTSAVSVGSSVTSTASTTAPTASATAPTVSASAPTVSTTAPTSTAVASSSSLASTTVSSSATSSSSTLMSSTTSVFTSLTTTFVTTTTTTSTTTTAPYCTTLVTFDDIPSQSATSGVVPNVYNNLNWTNTQYLNASTVPISGYPVAVASPPFIAYNPGGGMVTITTANGTRFAFNSIIVASAWRDSLIWSLYGFRAGVNLLYASFYIFVTNQTIVSCNGCSDWDTIYMTTSGGTPHGGLAQNGTEFGFDSLCISFGY